MRRRSGFFTCHTLHDSRAVPCDSSCLSIPVHLKQMLVVACVARQNWGNHIFEIDQIEQNREPQQGSNNGANVTIGLGGWHMTGAFGGM
jgi:hypothetical protein